MTFQDLPKGITDIPLTDRRVAADFIDLIVSEENRADGCLGIMVCDADDRCILPTVLPEPRDSDVEWLALLLDQILPLVAQRRGSVVLGRGRPRGGVPNDADRAGHQQSIDACARHGVPLLGFYLATRDGVFPLPEPLVAAS